jgi:hypothetical protein
MYNKINEEIKRITEIVVDNVDTEFSVEKESDDGGLHYVIYLPKDTCVKMLRSVLDDERLSKTYLIMMVPPEYIFEMLN